MTTRVAKYLGVVVLLCVLAASLLGCGEELPMASPSASPAAPSATAWSISIATLPDTRIIDAWVEVDGERHDANLTPGETQLSVTVAFRLAIHVEGIPTGGGVAGCSIVVTDPLNPVATGRVATVSPAMVSTADRVVCDWTT